MATRDSVLKLRLTGEEKALFEAAADASGLSLSAWVRRALRDRAREPQRPGEAHDDRPQPRAHGLEPVAEVPVEVLPPSVAATPTVSRRPSPPSRTSTRPAPPRPRYEFTPEGCPKFGMHRLCSEANPCRLCGATGAT